MIQLGDKVKDNITGFTGIANCRSIYLNGCISIQVISNKLGSDGKEIDEWFDEQRLEITSKAKSGGPQKRPPGLSRPK